MQLCVIICTYNRAGILGDTIDSFLAMDRPAGHDCRLLIVDNNSNDDTSSIARRHAENSPERIGYHFEPTPGLSYARNAGIRAAQADLIAFADDDVYFDKGWMGAIISAFVADPEAACAGGMSIPLFEAGRPDWVSESLLKIYGSTNSGTVPRLMQFPEHPFGLNMAFRRNVFESVGLFNSQLGRVGKNLLSNEESDLFFRIHAVGLKVRYVPEAIVHHRIAPERSSRKWALRRYYWQGISDVALRLMKGRPSRVALLREARWEFGRLLSTLIGATESGERALAVGHGFTRIAKGAYHLGVIRHTLAAALAGRVPS